MPSGNAIDHLASGEHWKRVKGFMWKYGGGMGRVDLFRIAEVDYAKVVLKITTLINALLCANTECSFAVLVHVFLI